MQWLVIQLLGTTVRIKNKHQISFESWCLMRGLIWLCGCNAWHGRLEKEWIWEERFAISRQLLQEGHRSLWETQDQFPNNDFLSRLEKMCTASTSFLCLIAENFFAAGWVLCGCSLLVNYSFKMEEENDCWGWGGGGGTEYIQVPPTPQHTHTHLSLRVWVFLHLRDASLVFSIYTVLVS